MNQESIPENIKKALTKYRKTLDMDDLCSIVSRELKRKDKAQQDSILMWLAWSLKEL